MSITNINIFLMFDYTAFTPLNLLASLLTISSPSADLGGNLIYFVFLLTRFGFKLNLPHTQGGELIYMSVANVYKVEGGMRIVKLFKK